LSISQCHEEKRRFIRLPIDVPVTIRWQDSSLTGTCRNLSGSGMLVIADRSLPMGEKVEVRIRQTSANQMPFHATAEVSRIEADEDGRTGIGLAILDIHD